MHLLLHFLLLGITATCDGILLCAAAARAPMRCSSCFVGLTLSDSQERFQCSTCCPCSSGLQRSTVRQDSQFWEILSWGDPCAFTAGIITALLFAFIRVIYAFNIIIRYLSDTFPYAANLQASGSTASIVPTLIRRSDCLKFAPFMSLLVFFISLDCSTWHFAAYLRQAFFIALPVRLSRLFLRVFLAVYRCSI